MNNIILFLFLLWR